MRDLGILHATALDNIVELDARYELVLNLRYASAADYEAELDLYLPTVRPRPNSTVIVIHGGGWTQGDKALIQLRLLPWLAQGWTVVNVNYRLAKVALAPAAIEDCHSALRWVHANAATYGLDVTRIVVTGFSAGGHLALCMAMLKSSHGNGQPSDVGSPLQVAAVVNWYGIT